MNLCPNKSDYYSQLNNEQDPFISCQSTTAAQCIDIVDDISILQHLGPHRQPEDNLRRFCKHDAETMSFCVQRHGTDWDKSVDHPSEWADVLIYAINKIQGYRCAYFDGFIIPQTLRKDISDSLPIQVSMQFKGISGHYVSVVGIEGENLIINDPYRDWLHNKDDGFNVIYSPKEFSDHCKGYGIRYLRRGRS